MRVVIGAVLLGLLASGVPAVAQEKYPSRPIEFVVPWGAGGGADELARKVASLAEPLLGVSLPVVNVPGATGVTGLTKMLAGEPDGYSISVMIADTWALHATSQPRWKTSDVVPLGVMIRQPSALFVAEGGKFKSFEDVVAAAKAGPVRVGVTGLGSVDELSCQYLNKKLGTKFVAVPIPRPGERYTAVLGGHAEVLFEQLGDVRSFITGKQLKPILVFAPKRYPDFADVPSSVELGHDITLPQFRMIVAKTGTDPARVKTLADILAKVAAMPDYVSFLKDSYADADSFLTGAAAATFLDGELAAMKRVMAEVKN